MLDLWEKKHRINIVDNIIKFRFLIAISIFILLVSFKINGSSIGAWDMYASELIDQTENSLIIGENRTIRSDEWMVQTTYYMAQAMSDDFYPLYNTNIMDDGLNMILAYNSPVANLSIIGKPFNWGFLLLGKEYGLSWYWAFKTIALWLLAFELSMMLTKKMKGISILASFWITFSPAIQWWFMQHVGDTIFFTLAMIVAFYKYVENIKDNKWKKLSFSLMFAFSAIGFALVIYPAFQVPLAYLTLVFMGVIYFGVFKTPKLKKDDYIFVSMIILIIGVVLGQFLLTSIDAIKATLETVYPGKRVSTGGGVELFRYSEFMINTYTPFRDINYLNNCEVSSFINFFIGSVIVLLIAISKKVKNIGIGIALFIVALLQFIWTVVPFNETIAKITFLSYVPTDRMMLMFNFTAMLLSIWAIGVIFREKIISPLVGGIIAVVNFSVYALLILKSPYRDYTNLSYLIILFAIYLIINVSIFVRWKRVFFVAMSILIFMSGMTVNPVVKGVGGIYNKTLSKAIIEIEENDPDSVWLAEGNETKGEFIYANGAKAINGTHFYPALSTWKKISEDYDDEIIYNRYAHVKISLTTDETKFILGNADAFEIDLNIEELKTLNIKYIVTKNDLSNILNEDNIKFEEIYHSEVDGNRIYKVIY
ncbi:hypothetical protein [Clostridium sp. D53t1_180928_C8]|uniref:DUF7657 domain-containing protein n=1 Tax=Clostridium sp. D53t1_180928_C8 TaxID=2787101 RepID=UPI0018AB05E3|nr:hypothetical protein [Clostridium sp. D53t1_180928_C8]